ncbi:MAG: hypothetical protein QXO71_07885 [Candidatus Jordarchaeaceae archaeon]
MEVEGELPGDIGIIDDRYHKYYKAQKETNLTTPIRLRNLYYYV